jgi:selenoprotein W-related protein
VSLTESILHKFKNDVKSLELKPSGGGVFEVTVNGKLLFSKKETGRFPEPGEIENKL